MTFNYIQSLIIDECFCTLEINHCLGACFALLMGGRGIIFSAWMV